MSRIFIISAPSGTGKGTIISRLLEDDDKLYYSVSMTTRSPREGEIDGVHYIFVTKEEFLKKLSENMILEYTEYCNNYYGTPLDKLNEKMSEGYNCILEIDVVGAKNIMKIRPDAVSIFIEPPSFEELKRRLLKRGTENDDIIAARLKKAKEEMKDKDLFNYRVINGDLKTAVLEIKNIILKEDKKI